jgi:formamidopyrimidine-DNA glycosylase
MRVTEGVSSGAMPELPEVEAVVRALRPLVVGRKITSCRVLHPIAVRPSSGHGAKLAAARIEKSLRGRKVTGVTRLGKFLLMPLDRGIVAMHFRLDGQMVWFDSKETRGHIDVAIGFGKGTLGFVDRRHFGRVEFEEDPGKIAGLAKLGVDPLSKGFTREKFAQLLSKSTLPLKLFLLDQKKVAGIGNIYSNEAMWLARLKPMRRARSLSPIEAARLHKSIGAVLRRALKCCLHPAPNFRDPNWWFQGIEDILNVYGREGKKCRRSDGTILRTEQGGRSTFWCRGCQK